MNFDSYAKIKKTPYLEAVLLESLRLHPSVPFLLRFAVKDIPIPSKLCDEYNDGNKDNKVIRKGDGIIIPNFAHAYQTEYWGADCAKFKPSRFLRVKTKSKHEDDADHDDDDDDDEVEYQNPSSVYSNEQFAAFNLAPRVCLGKHVALLEAKIAILKILNVYNIRLNDQRYNQGFKYVFAPVIQLQNGLNIEFTKRVLS